MFAFPSPSVHAGFTNLWYIVPDEGALRKKQKQKHSIRPERFPLPLRRFSEVFHRKVRKGFACEVFKSAAFPGPLQGRRAFHGRAGESHTPYPGHRCSHNPPCGAKAPARRFCAKKRVKRLARGRNGQPAFSAWQKRFREKPCTRWGEGRFGQAGDILARKTSQIRFEKSGRLQIPSRFFARLCAASPPRGRRRIRPGFPPSRQATIGGGRCRTSGAKGLSGPANIPAGVRQTPLARRLRFSLF